MDLLSDIQFRRKLWIETHPSSEFSILPCTDICSSRCYPFTEALHFSSIDAANSSIIHNTAVILVHQFATSVHQLLPANAYDIVLEDGLAPTHVSSAVKQILQSIDYYFTLTCPTSSSGSRASGLVGSGSYLFLPLRVAFIALARSTSLQDIRQTQWLMKTFSFIEDSAQPWTSNKQLFTLK